MPMKTLDFHKSYECCMKVEVFHSITSSTSFNKIKLNESSSESSLFAGDLIGFIPLIHYVFFFSSLDFSFKFLNGIYFYHNSRPQKLNNIPNNWLRWLY